MTCILHLSHSILHVYQKESSTFELQVEHALSDLKKKLAEILVLLRDQSVTGFIFQPQLTSTSLLLQGWLKMHDLKMTNHPNYRGGGWKCRTLKRRIKSRGVKMTVHFHGTQSDPSFLGPAISGSAFSCLACSSLSPPVFYRAFSAPPFYHVN